MRVRGFFVVYFGTQLAAGFDERFVRSDLRAMILNRRIIKGAVAKEFSEAGS